MVPTACSLDPLVVFSVTVFPFDVVTGVRSTGSGFERGVVATRRGFLLGVRISDGVWRFALGAVVVGLLAVSTVAGTSFNCGCAAVSAFASCRSCASEVSDASASSGLSPCLQAPSARVTAKRTGVAILEKVDFMILISSKTETGYGLFDRIPFALLASGPAAEDYRARAHPATTDPNRRN